MDFIVNAYLAALVLGALHALEVDHMVAVSVFAGLKPRMAAAANYGARWGIGHGLVVLIAGGVLAWLGIKLPETVVGWGELLVGIALIGLGLWAMVIRKQFHTHAPAEHDHHQESLHGHLHAHGGQQPHHHLHAHNPKAHHQHLPTALGALHGLAGSAPILALVPVTLLDNFGQAIIYLLLFSLGTTVSMTLYAMLAAAAVQGLGFNNKSVKIVTTVISTATIFVGVWWSYAALSGFLK